MIDSLKNGNRLDNYAMPKQGLATGDNERFLRAWYEICIDSVGFNIRNNQDAKASDYKWFPFNKGGVFRKWYGNREFVVNWENDGYEIKNFKDISGKVRSRPQNLNCYFSESISCSAISSSGNSFRFYPKGSIFDVNFRSLFLDNNNINYLLALLNSKIIRQLSEILSPTIALNMYDFNRFPIIEIRDEEINNCIKGIVSNNILISRTDWDFFETSWDFKSHPLVALRISGATAWADQNPKCRISFTFKAWEMLTDGQFAQLKANEEELNRIFIEIYGLEEELTPEVEDKDVTIRKADLGRDIRSLISYAVGCMLGRYSLDIEGLVYAGGEWEADKYTTIIPDADNIIPITDEEYFDDDMVARLVNFVKVVYGEASLEENLDFIAGALGNKGNTAREVIRNYFLKDFYKDHLKIYQKRPIYWLFDSGKENGFKALIYMHRYDQDTVGRVRTDYLHKIQAKLEDSLNHCNVILASEAPAGEKAAAVKKKEKLIKQLAETRLYDQAIAHIALSRLAIDLDDGVKVNYAKFQDVEVASEGKKAVKVNLLAKV